jgi:hypothetical protein
MTDQDKHDELHDEKRDRLGKTLRSAVPPMGKAEPPRDLWPRMLQRIEETSERPVYPRRPQWFAGVPWFDWALLGVAAVAMLLFPALIPALLYHL